MIPQFNSIILDVVVIVLLLLALVIGSVKGLKHVLINFILLAGSFALTFSPLLLSLKTKVIDLLADKIKLGVGVDEAARLAIMMAYMFMVTLAFTLIIFILLRLVKSIIMLILKKKLGVKPKSKVVRITGAFSSLVLNGALVVMVVSLLAHPSLASTTVETSYVTKHVAQVDNALLGLLVDDYDKFEDKLVVKYLMGDFVAKVEDNEVKHFNSLVALMNKEVLETENMEGLQNSVNFLYHGLSFVEGQLMQEVDGKMVAKDGFAPFVNELEGMVVKVISRANTLRGESSAKIDNIDNTLAVNNLLIKLGIETNFEDIFIMR